MKKYYLPLLLGILFFAVTNVNAQVTSAAMGGIIKSSDGEPLEAATVVAVHLPSGTQYGTTTREDGRFNLRGMRVGGPYKVVISYIGFEDVTKADVYLTLGKEYALNEALTSSAVDLQEIVVTVDAIINSDRTGTGTNVGKEALERMPTVSRGFEDFTRLTPQASFRNGNLTVAGLGNRYNDIRIDGAGNADPYGRNQNGQNGGQTGVNPISIDAVEQVQINLSPYDITQSGFAGASINAVTRSGDNNLSGSAYYFVRNENLSGKTPVDNDTDPREKLTEFTNFQTGFRLGGPLIKNKLFFFVNGEITKSDAPLQFKPGTAQSNISAEDMIRVATHLKEAYGYDPGPWENVSPRPASNKVLARLDWNINDKHSLMFRYHWTDSESITNILRAPNRAQFENLPRAQTSTTNSMSLELNSLLTNKLSNTFRFAMTNVADNRQPFDGVLFPEIDITAPSGRIEAGGYADLDYLKNNTWSITNNTSYYLGKHSFTAGFNFEGIYTQHQRISDYYGNYRFDNIDDFENNVIDRILHQYPKTGNPDDITADFNIYTLGIYAEDNIQITDDFKLGIGLRIDLPFLPDDARIIPEIESSTAFGTLRSGIMPKTKIHWDPRISFNWDIGGKGTTQLRGGAGYFMGRFNTALFAGMFQNNGLLTAYSLRNQTQFQPDPLKQPTFSEITGNPEASAPFPVELMDNDRKFLQLFRANLAIDKKLPGGIVATAEVMYSKLINDNNVTNLNLGDPIGTLEGADNRPLYNANVRVDPRFLEVIYISDRSDAYSFTSTISLQKKFGRSLLTTLAYNNTYSQNVFESVSVFNITNWQRQLHINGLNNLEKARARDESTHRIIGTMTYQLDKGIFENNNFNISAIYIGTSGHGFSYVYDNDPINVTTIDQTNTLIYIPRNASEIVLQDPTQWDALNRFIENDPYLKNHRGEYAQRNGPSTPWEHSIDLRLSQDLSFVVGGKRQTIQLTFDIFNFTNLLNKKWGHRFNETGPGWYELLVHRGYVAGTRQPIYSFNEGLEKGWIISDNVLDVQESSRWLGQFGIRYKF